MLLPESPKTGTVGYNNNKKKNLVLVLVSWHLDPKTFGITGVIKVSFVANNRITGG
jgi:hypothetical protein